MTDEYQHRFESWIRESCVGHAISRNKYRSIEETLAEAKKIEKYVLDTPDATVLTLEKSDATS